MKLKYDERSALQRKSLPFQRPIKNDTYRNAKVYTKPFLTSSYLLCGD
jgi:hypothetical protein